MNNDRLQRPAARPGEERLQKLLASAGVASRRACEELIRVGRVTVNGRVVTELGRRADLTRDDVRLDGRPVKPPAAHTYLILHKPAGYTSTVADRHASQTVMELLPPGTPRVYPVGRLDRESEGLLLLTDDGELALRLQHPQYHIPKEYVVLVRGRITEPLLDRLRRGVPVAGVQTQPAEIEPGEAPPFARKAGPEDGGTLWLRFVLYEGRKRQIREMCRQVGLEVERLVRLRMGPLTLGRLRSGAVRDLNISEVAQLRRAGELEAPIQSRGSRRPDRRPSPGRTPAGASTPVRPRAPGPSPHGSANPRPVATAPQRSAGRARQGRNAAGAATPPARRTYAPSPPLVRSAGITGSTPASPFAGITGSSRTFKERAGRGGKQSPTLSTQARRTPTQPRATQRTASPFSQQAASPTASKGSLPGPPKRAPISGITSAGSPHGRRPRAAKPRPPARRSP